MHIHYISLTVLVKLGGMDCGSVQWKWAWGVGRKLGGRGRRSWLLSLYLSSWLNRRGLSLSQGNY